MYVTCIELLLVCSLTSSGNIRWPLRYNWTKWR